MNGTPLPKVLVIVGSSRENSNTLNAVQKLCPFEAYETVNLSKQAPIKYYNYETDQMAGDGFLEIAHKMQQSDIIVFATPVYWYSMSGQMKVFFDRLTELLYEHKPIGKSLKGKKTYLISSGGESTLPEGFEVPFRRTSEYFDMEYMGAFYQQD